MAFINPFVDDPERARAWEQGYLAGFAEPEIEHQPPLQSKLLDIFFQGEQAGRDDRRREPATQDPLPASDSDEISRFEIAPDGQLIPIPDEGPPGNPIRKDAQITVNNRTAAGYYVVIFNGPPESHADVAHFLIEVTSEAAQTQLEHMLARAVVEGSRAIIRFGGFIVSVAISILTPSPILKESRFRCYLQDTTAISYVILDPQH